MALEGRQDGRGGDRDRKEKPFRLASPQKPLEARVLDLVQVNIAYLIIWTGILQILNVFFDLRKGGANTRKEMQRHSKVRLDVQPHFGVKNIWYMYMYMYIYSKMPSRIMCQTIEGDIYYNRRTKVSRLEY